MIKKILFILCAFTMCLILSGCGDKTQEVKNTTSKTGNVKVLECSYSEDDEYKTSITTYLNFNSKKSTFTDGSAKLEMTIPDEIISVFKDKDICKLFTQNLSESFESCKSSFNGNVATMNFILNVDKLENDKDSNFKKTATLEEAKTEIEKDGTKCIIK